MSRAPQWNAQLIQHYYSPFGTTQLEKKVKNFNLSGPQGPRIYRTPPSLNRYIPSEKIGPNCNCIRLSGSSIEPKTGILGQKGASWGTWPQKKRPNTRSKFVVTISSTQLDQLAAVGTKSDPRAGQGRPGPSEGLFWAKTGPFRCPRSALEVC